MRLGAIGIDQNSGEPIIVLQDEDKKRILPIWIGLPEAKAISFAVNKVASPRPLTHNLLFSMISALGYCVKEVAIDGLETGVFKATIALEPINNPKGQSPIFLDSRPSDAVAVAVLAGVPLMVSPDILARAGVPADPVLDEKEASDFKEFISNVSASDFAKFALFEDHQATADKGDSIANPDDYIDFNVDVDVDINPAMQADVGLDTDADTSADTDKTE